MAININREVEDTFYRYKMPKLVAKVEGKGNGIKTVIVNVTDIARALYRKPMYVTKYFGCELGAQVNVDEKNERYIVNGAHDAEKLQQLLDGFIKKFVLCPNCSNPETELSVKKKTETVKATCKACGATKILDPVHRLTQFIIKNPPESTSSKRSQPTKGTPNNKQAAQDSADEDEDSPGNATIEDRGGDDDEDWGEDTTEEAQKKRMEELSSVVKALALSSDVEKSKSERAQMFFTFIARLNESGDLVQQVKDVVDEADRLDLGTHSVLVLVEVLLKDPETVVQKIKLHAALFRALVESVEFSHKAQLNLLNGLVTLCDQYPDMVKKVGLIVKTLYDEEICDEEVILQWADKGPSSRYGPKKVHESVLAKCQLLFEWLRDADEDDSDDEDGNDDEKPAQLSVQPSVNGVKPQSSVQESVGASDEDDLDIDAI